MKNLFNLNDRVIYNLSKKDWVGTIYKVRKYDYIVKFDDPEFDGWVEDGVRNLWYVNEEDLKPAADNWNYIVPLADMKRIYDVACDAWKRKIAGMIEPFADHAVVTNEMAEKMLNAATPSQRPIVEDVLKNAGYKFETKPEYFEFKHDNNVINTGVNGHPLFILAGLADEGFEFKEVGFIHETDWMPVLVREDGTEEDITRLKIRFKARK
jgi:hypothetical protein